MVSVKNLSIVLRKDHKKLVDNISFDLNTGDRLAIIGEEGDGKSTLVKSVISKDLVKDYADVSGEVVIKEKTGYLPQFLDSKWEDSFVYEFYLKKNFEDDLDMNGYAELAKHKSLFKTFGFDPDVIYEDKNMKDFSGGERIKLRLIKILMDNPTFLVLDEPTNDLDINSLIWLEDFVNSFNGIVAYVSHDDNFIENTANKIIHLEQLKKKNEPRWTFYKGKHSDYVMSRTEAFEKQSKMASAEYKKWADTKRKMAEMKANAASNTAYSRARIRQIKSVERRLEKQKDSMTQEPEFEEAINIMFKNNKPLPSKKIVVNFKGDVKVGEKILQQNIDFKLVGPQKVAIIGENGAGKTTLLKKLKQNIEANTNLKVGYMAQNYDQQLPQNQNSIDFLTQKVDNTNITEIRTCLGCLKFTRDEMEADIQNLSGGQKAKLLIASFILSDCDVLLLDEPTRNLSPLSAPVLNDILSRYKGAIIAVSHDRNFIEKVCDEVYPLKKKTLSVSASTMEKTL